MFNRWSWNFRHDHENPESRVHGIWEPLQVRGLNIGKIILQTRISRVVSYGDLSLVLWKLYIELFHLCKIQFRFKRDWNQAPEATSNQIITDLLWPVEDPCWSWLLEFNVYSWMIVAFIRYVIVACLNEIFVWLILFCGSVYTFLCL